MNASSWLDHNRQLLGSSYEELFVVNVLSTIKDLPFDRISAQFPFIDLDGRQRYADFVFQEGEHVRIAIEVDGYDKRGTGSGMTHGEFVDWQRRQASLTSAGWHVLRFANRDVVHSPERCAEHIELLLRHERSKGQHISNLESRVSSLGEQLEATKKARRSDQQTQSNTENAAAQAKLEAELKLARRQLQSANRARSLSDGEQKKLDKFEELQAAFELQAKDSSIMKTTIWAFVVLIAILTSLFTLTITKQSSPTPSPDTDNPTSASAPNIAAAQLGADCSNPISWSQAGLYRGAVKAVKGPVIEVTQSKANGNPVWINVGDSFPSPKRFTLVIWGRNLNRFPSSVLNLEGKSVCAIGEIEEYRGVSQIELRSPGQLQ